MSEEKGTSGHERPGLLKRTEIMKMIPEIKNATKFFNLCRDLNINPVSEFRYRSTLGGLYDPSVVEIIRREAQRGDRRRWS